MGGSGRAVGRVGREARLPGRAAGPGLSAPCTVQGWRQLHASARSGTELGPRPLCYDTVPVTSKLGCVPGSITALNPPGPCPRSSPPPPSATPHPQVLWSCCARARCHTTTGTGCRGPRSSGEWWVGSERVEGWVGSSISDHIEARTSSTGAPSAARDHNHGTSSKRRVDRWCGALAGRGRGVQLTCLPALVRTFPLPGPQPTRTHTRPHY